MNDMSQVIIPKSDQWNADDFIAGPQTFTIAEVRISAGSEQPVSIVLEGTPKFYRPCKSMSRVLVQAWGADANKYVGHSLTLYRDPKVKWAGMEIGGIRISHMTGIDSPKQMMLTATKGSRKPFQVLPLVVEPTGKKKDFARALADLKAIAKPGQLDALGAAWKNIGADARKALAAELPALKAACAEDVPFDAETGEITQPEAAATRTMADQLGLDDDPAQRIKDDLETAADAGDGDAVESIIAAAEARTDLTDEQRVSLEVAFSKARGRVGERV